MEINTALKGIAGIVCSRQPVDMDHVANAINDLFGKEYITTGQAAINAYDEIKRNGDGFKYFDIWGMLSVRPVDLCKWYWIPLDGSISSDSEFRGLIRNVFGHICDEQNISDKTEQIYQSFKQSMNW